jgi:hypothetical protein
VMKELWAQKVCCPWIAHVYRTVAVMVESDMLVNVCVSGPVVACFSVCLSPSFPVYCHGKFGRQEGCCGGCGGLKGGCLLIYLSEVALGKQR